MGYLPPRRISQVMTPASLGLSRRASAGMIEPKLTRTSLDGVLCFEYVEEDAGSVPAEVSTDHTMIIPVQPDPIRIIAERDGRVERLTLNNGDVALAHAGTLAGWQWLDPARVILIHINPEAFRHFTEVELKVLITGSALEDRVVIHDPDLRSAADRMRATLMAGDIGADVVFDALARVFLVLLVRRYGKRGAPQAEFGAQFGVAQYAKLVTFIEDRLGEKITPAQMARELGMSEAAFARKFKLKVGQTPMRFVSQMRLEAAARYISDTDLPLAEVALRCGFSDQAHLSRSFKKTYGCSPTTYKTRQMAAQSSF